MNRKLALALSIAVLFASENAYCFIPLSPDLTASGGYFSTSVNPSDKAPTLLQFGIGLAIKYPLADWFSLGVVTDYRFINQYSSITTNVGNRQGKRWNPVAPMIELHGGPFSLKADYQFLGDYKLPYITVDGTDGLAYQTPSGFRVMGLYHFFAPAPVWLGGFYESIQFKKVSLPVTPLPLKTWQAGALIELRPFESTSRY